MPTDESPHVSLPSRQSNVARTWAGVLFAVLLLAAAYVILATPIGAQLRSDPEQLASRVRNIQHDYPVSSVAAYLAIYFLSAMLLLPVWWLQVLAGAAFGLYEATVLSLIAATAGAVTSAGLSRWFGGEWMRHRVESRLTKLKTVDEALGSNGLLVVFAVRLVHLLPFGICNYALGLTRITMKDILIGTLLGSVPAVALYVGVGAGYHPWSNWRFLSMVGLINVVLLIPVGMQYWARVRAKRAGRHEETPGRGGG